MPGYWRQVGLIRLPGGRWSAERTTFVGSMIPLATMSQYSPTCALKP